MVGSLKGKNKDWASEITNLPLPQNVLNRGGEDDVDATGTWPDAACGVWEARLMQFIGAVLSLFLVGQSNFQSIVMK